MAFLLIALIPVAIAAVFRFKQAVGGDGSFDGLYLFTNVIMTFFLQFLVLILTLSHFFVQHFHEMNQPKWAFRSLMMRWALAFGFCCSPI